jgi:PBP1b-binding outer membrane lipoprotein LpoB
MKKVILALAIVSVAFVACNNDEKKTETPAGDSTKVEAPKVDSPAVVAPVVDTMKKVVDSVKK